MSKLCSVMDIKINIDRINLLNRINRRIDMLYILNSCEDY